MLETREPGGAPGAEILRGLLLSGEVGWSLPAETLLHFAARAEHVERTIRPALAAGTWVVCDRFYDSTMVYQGYGQGGDRAAIATLIGLLGIVPDLTLVLDVDVPTSHHPYAGTRRGARSIRAVGRGFFARVREGFLVGRGSRAGALRDDRRRRSAGKSGNPTLGCRPGPCRPA